MRFLIFQINTDFLIDQLEKYFYTRHLTLLLHSKKTFLLSIPDVFWKINFLPHFNLLSQRMRCAIFQINTDLLKIYEHINIFTQEALTLLHLEASLKIHLSFFPKSSWRSLARRFLEAAIFYHMFTGFGSGWGVQYFNKSQLLNMSVKYLLFYTKDLVYLFDFQRKVALSITEVPGNIRFLLVLRMGQVFNITNK